MIKCEQCFKCENIDNTYYELSCMIDYPKPVIVDGKCNRFEDHALFAQIEAKEQSLKR